jgi:hypothetical protein
MGEGDHPVLAALPDRHRHPDAGQLEPPRPGERDVVVEPAPDAVGHRLAVRRRHIGSELAGERRHVDRRDKIAERRRHLLAGYANERLGLPLKVGLQLGRSGQRGPELLLVLPAHPCQRVQPLSAKRSHTGHGGAGQHLLAEQRGARQRMRAAAGGTDRVAAIHTEVRKNRGGVSGTIGHGPTRLA